MNNKVRLRRQYSLHAPCQPYHVKIWNIKIDNYRKARSYVDVATRLLTNCSGLRLNV